MANTHHDAAEGYERRGGKTELFGAEQRGDDNIAASLKLAVGLDNDARAQIVEDERLMSFRETELPWDAGVFDASEGRSAGAAIVTADQDHIGVGLGDSGGDRS